MAALGHALLGRETVISALIVLLTPDYGRLRRGSAFAWEVASHHCFRVADLQGVSFEPWGSTRVKAAEIIRLPTAAHRVPARLNWKVRRASIEIPNDVQKESGRASADWLAR